MDDDELDAELAKAIKDVLWAYFRLSLRLWRYWDSLVPFWS